MSWARDEATSGILPSTHQVAGQTLTSKSSASHMSMVAHTSPRLQLRSLSSNHTFLINDATMSCVYCHAELCLAVASVGSSIYVVKHKDFRERKLHAADRKSYVNVNGGIHGL